ncbi:hypothetical protein FH972_019495 [Carpinus fangiana]|uniref:Uncharacterized protein n=1 Tax=Carpinus fangiana TaxID=176857 RepID=A0A5N6RSH7_9ROSI|nr:hypothetical protein FH972_019495 [Carpinus fangiana]
MEGVGQLREGVDGDSDEAEGSDRDPLLGPHRARGNQGSKLEQDEEDAQLVGPHVVRNRRGHRRRQVRPHRPRGSRRRRPRRRLWHLGFALRLLLHQL